MWEISAVIVPLQIGVIVSLLAAFSAWNRSYLYGNKSFAVFMLILAWWAFAYSVELTVTTEASKLFWAKLQYFSIPFVPPTMILFVANASNIQNKWFHRGVPYLYIIPILTLFMIFLRQEWIWSEITMIDVGKSRQLDNSYGFWFIGYFIYSFILFSIGFILIFRLTIYSPRLTRFQTTLFLFGASIPMAINTVYVLELSILPNIDLTPLMLVTFGFLTAFAVFEFSPTDLLPIVYDAAFDSLPDAVLVLNADYHVQTGNPAAQKRFNLTERRLNNLPVDHLLPGQWVKVIKSADPAKPAIFEVSNIKSDGTNFIYELRLVPLIDRRGRNKGQMVFIRDITERKEALNALARREQELAERVQERTATLQATNNELLRIVQMKDEFLANMSHELRTPLSAVIGTAEALQEGVYGNLDTRQNDPMGRIDDSAKHLLSLINDILDVSRIEAGQFTLRVEKIAIDDLCTNCLNLVLPDAQKKDIQLSSLFEINHPYLTGDERRIRQILLNLLSNAIKFTPNNGSVGLSVSNDSRQQTTKIVVWDTGIGIDNPDQKRIFEPFVQLDSALSREYEGTGLGLALTARLATMHGGSVMVESRLGSGSRFTVILPWDCRPVATAPFEDVETNVELKGSVAI